MTTSPFASLEATTKHVRSDALVIVPELQPRHSMNPAHVRALACLVTQGHRLDPLTVWRDPAGRLVLMDGHHRLAAYVKAGKGSRVPARIHDGPEAEARRLPVYRNAKASLPLTYGERADYAWSLVLHTNLTRPVIAGDCALSTRTVTAMRTAKARWEALGESPPRSWFHARNGGTEAPQPEEADDMPDRIEIEADALTEAAGKALHAAARRSPEAVVLAVSRILGHRFEPALEWLGVDRDDADTARDF
jgi:ParB-like chromosome segregation protein Spo0J